MAAGLFLVPYYNHPDYNRPRPCPADLTLPIQKKQPMAAFLRRERFYYPYLL